jgi:hypothetical protein
MRKSAGNSTQNMDFKTVKKLVKAYTRRSRGFDIQLTPVAVCKVKGRTI